MSTTTKPAMNGAEFSLLRYELGLTITQVATDLNVNPRTVRAWNAGRDPIPPGVLDELQELRREHQLDIEHTLQDGFIAIPYASPEVAWSLSVASAARRINPGIEVLWDYEWNAGGNPATSPAP